MELIAFIRMFPVAGFIFLATIATTVYDFSTNLSLRDKFMYNPYRIIHYSEYGRLITCSLIHGDWAHLIFNMITLYSFGFGLSVALGRREGMEMGQLYFLIIYLVSLFVSHVSTITKYKDNPHYNALGASGAISGVVFGYILFSPFNQLQLFFFLPLPAWVFAILYLVYSYYSAKKSNDNIGHDAHLWGALGGLAITAALFPEQVGFTIGAFAYKLGLRG